MPTARKRSWIARLKDRWLPTRREVVDKLGKAVRWSDSHIPLGVRSLIAIPLIVGGVFSFLPILGLWMLPLGAALIALDIPGLRRRMLHRLEREEVKVGLRPRQPNPGKS